MLTVAYMESLGPWEQDAAMRWFTYLRRDACVRAGLVGQVYEYLLGLRCYTDIGDGGTGNAH